jgi:hypothetical protein
MDRRVKENPPYATCVASHASAISRAACDKSTRRANHFRFTEIVSSLEIKNISLLQKDKSAYIFTHPVPPEGRIMIARIVGTGRGGRW